MKIFNFIKEVLQYAGIIILSCLSALWLEKRKSKLEY